MTIRITALNPQLVYEAGSTLTDPEAVPTPLPTGTCCEFAGPGIGDSSPVITVTTGASAATDITIWAEGCTGGENCGYEDSYCLSPRHRLLTADLRWVPCRDISVGDELLAFEESPQPGNRNRRYQRSLVLRSEPAVKKCVRVTLSNGDIIDCSADHPWLVTDLRHNRRWVKAEELMWKTSVVQRTLDTWELETSFEAGWLSGMFDGEGCITGGKTATGMQLRLSVSQKPGIILDLLRERLSALKIPFGGSHHPSSSAYTLQINGFKNMLRALGCLQPARLLKNFAGLPIELCSVKAPIADHARVISVEYLGDQEVQSIATSTKTYIGEGYLMHNSDTYCDVTEGGVYPNASITDTEYRIADLPANSMLVIDAVEEKVTLTDDEGMVQTGGVEALEWAGIFEWIRAAKGGCQRVCVDVGSGSADVEILVFDREL